MVDRLLEWVRERWSLTQAVVAEGPLAPAVPGTVIAGQTLMAGRIAFQNAGTKKKKNPGPRDSQVKAN